LAASASGALLRLIAGTAFGQQAPASVFSAMFYLDATLEAGAPVDGPRYIWWNFVSSSRERIPLPAQ